MKDRSWTQQMLAGRIGLSRSHLSKLLGDNRKWTLDALQRLASVLERTLEELVAGTSVQDEVAASAATQKQLADIGAQLASVASERDALELERDSLRTEVEALRAEVAERPTRKEHEHVREQCSAAEEREALAQRRANASEVQLRRQEVDVSRRLSSLQAQLGAANQGLLHNANVAYQFKSVAESRGATLSGLAIFGLGIGILAAASNG